MTELYEHCESTAVLISVWVLLCYPFVCLQFSLGKRVARERCYSLTAPGHIRCNIRGLWHWHCPCSSNLWIVQPETTKLWTCCMIMLRRHTAWPFLHWEGLIITWSPCSPCKRLSSSGSLSRRWGDGHRRLMRLCRVALRFKHWDVLCVSWTVYQGTGSIVPTETVHCFPNKGGGGLERKLQQNNVNVNKVWCITGYRQTCSQSAGGDWGADWLQSFCD